MILTLARLILKLSVALAVCLGASDSWAETACAQMNGALMPMSGESLRALDAVMKNIAPRDERAETDYATHPLDDSAIRGDGKWEPIGMQIGRGGNPDIDKGKPFRDKSWSVSVLYPVKQTHIGRAPTTVYVEARCASLGQQPASAHTDNINIRCGPGIVGDVKLNKMISAYGRLGLVTSRFSHNGAPEGQINPKTGVEYRLYQNNTGFTGAAIGAGVKVRVTDRTLVFAEYTKYKVQQTDNPAYQFRGGFNAGIARSFWLFQGPKN